MADDDGTDKPAAKTFTQADVDRLIRDRLAREREKFADYDELKTAAAAGDKSKTQLDKIESELSTMRSRAEKADAALLRREVADELGLTAKQARRLSGSTREELLADGREYMEDNGIKGKAERAAETDAGKGKGTDDGTDDEGSEETEQRQPAQRPARPRENLRSGAPMTEGKPTETDPMKLAAMVPRR
jgi:hypothetical protein